MATEMSKGLLESGKYGVGALHSHNPQTLNFGAVVEGAIIENYTLGELGFNEAGERTVKQLSDKANKSVLVASPERRFLGEGISHFFNDIGERARCIFPEVGETRFSTSNFELNTSVTDVKAGQVAHYDTTKKKFLIQDVGSEHVDYSTAELKLVVVSNDLGVLDGKDMIKLEVTSA